MDRITSNQVSDLMEAYAAVYAPQEITEGQVWEEVEAWVNSLVEEGHDLSEYTWEDMYDAYIEEQGPRSSRGVSDPAVQARWGQIGRTIMYGQSGKPAPRKPTAQQQMRQRIQANRPAASTPAAKSTPSASQNLKGLSVGPGGFNINGRPVQTTPARPAARPAAPAPAARPAAPAARPAAPAPKAAPTTPTSYAGVKPATNVFTGNASIGKPTTTATPAKKPSLASQAAELRAMRAASQARQGLTQSFDAFDVIKGHLLDEGYADTEEAALKIMANMSEEWKQSIVLEQQVK